MRFGKRKKKRHLINYMDDKEFDLEKYRSINGIGRSALEKQREKYAKDLVQPYNKDGSINKDFKKLYPNSEFIRKKYD